MSNSEFSIPKEFEELPLRDHIEYVQNLWDFIAQSGEELPLPESHKKVLDERLAAYEADPDQGKPWEEVREQILRKLREP